jgi:hypothetical protein
MSIRVILLPVCIEIALTFILLFWTYSQRPRRTAVVSDRADAPDWHGEVAISTPFYVLTIFAWHTQFADLLFLLLSWVFVVLRVLHAGSHRVAYWAVPHEGLFIGSAIVLALMWTIYALRILLALG